MTRHGRPENEPWRRRVTRSSGPDGTMIGSILTTVGWREHEHGAGMTPSSMSRRWKRQLATLASRRITLSDEQRHRLLTLGQDLAAVWEHPAASAALKKRLLRTVLHEMIIDTLPEPPEHLLQLHWHGGVHTELRVARHTVGKHGRATPAAGAGGDP